MKVTDEGVEYLIETPRYHYFEYSNGSLMPKSLAFKGIFLGSSYIQDLRFIDWMGMMLNNKIVVASENMPTEEESSVLEKISPLKDPYLVVINVDAEYLTTTLFTIVNSLLGEGSKIKSLEWNN